MATPLADLPKLLDLAADALVAVPAVYVAARGLYGHVLEKRAARAADTVRRDGLLEDARLFYASASLQRPWVLSCLLAGTAIQVLVGLYEYLA